MENLVVILTTDPLRFIAYGLAVFAGYGVLLFVAGFFGAIKHVIYYSEGAEHVDHARVRALWGLYVVMVAFGTWKLVKLPFSNEAVIPTLILSILLLTPLWIPALKTALSGGGGGH